MGGKIGEEVDGQRDDGWVSGKGRDGWCLSYSVLL